MHAMVFKKRSLNFNDSMKANRNTKESHIKCKLLNLRNLHTTSSGGGDDELSCLGGGGSAIVWEHQQQNINGTKQ
jgi:hypothetical protein